MQFLIMSSWGAFVSLVLSLKIFYKFFFCIFLQLQEYFKNLLSQENISSTAKAQKPPKPNPKNPQQKLAKFFVINERNVLLTFLVESTGI